MSIIFGSPEANVILKTDQELIKQLKEIELGADRIEEIEKELVDIHDEIFHLDDQIQGLKMRRNDLLSEKKRLESGEPG